MKPDAKILIRGPSRNIGKCLFLAMTGGVALILWLRSGDSKSGHTTIAADTPVAQVFEQTKVASPIRPSSRNIEISTDALRGGGITIVGWLQKILEAAPGSVHLTPNNLLTLLPALKVCEYEGDVSLPIGETLDVLRYAGLAIVPVQDGFEVHWADSSSRIADDLYASTDPDNPAWGALRAWQHVEFKVDPEWRAPFRKNPVADTLADMRTLCWAIQGEVCVVDIGSDGHVAAARSNGSVNNEIDLVEVLLDCAKNPAFVFDANACLAGYATSESQPAFRKLVEGLKSQSLEVRRISAWALGRVRDATAVETLVSLVEDKDTPQQLVSAALTALQYSEKANREMMVAAIDAEQVSRRRVEYQRLYIWLSQFNPRNSDAKSDKEYATALLSAAQSFRVDTDLPYLISLRGQLNAISPKDSDASIQIAGPNWRHVNLDSNTALKMLRSAVRRNQLAALWRWNRLGADSATDMPLEDVQAMLGDAMRSLVNTSPSSALRRLALEALFRPSDPRSTGGSRALSDDVTLALKVFLNDASPSVQQSAGALVGRLGELSQLQSLIRAEFAAKPPAGTDQLINGLVRRFWIENSDDEGTVTALNALVDQLLTSSDTHVAERSAWAKMQSPNLSATEKLRVAKTMPNAVLRAVALKSINVSQARAEIHSKFVDVFLYDDSAAVREAVFSAGLPLWVKAGAGRTKLFERGLTDVDASVRLAALKSKLSQAAHSRGELCERVKLLVANDASKEVRAAAVEWINQSK